MELMPTDDTFRLRPTPRYREVLRLAEAQARHHDHRHLGIEHLMLAILDSGRSVATGVLQRFVDLQTLRDEIEGVLASDGYNQAPSPPPGEDYFQHSGHVAVRLVSGGERQEATIRWGWQARNGPEELYWAQLEWAGPRVDVAADDLFEALVRIREQLEPHGWFVAVQGSRLDSFPSGMQRETAGGLRVYVMRMGEPTRPEDVIETFAEADPSLLATVTAQRKRAEDWARSVRGSSPVDRQP
jgi:hypothetical protein